MARVRTEPEFSVEKQVAARYLGTSNEFHLGPKVFEAGGDAVEVTAEEAEKLASFGPFDHFEFENWKPASEPEPTDAPEPEPVEGPALGAGSEANAPSPETLPDDARLDKPLVETGDTPQNRT